MISEKGEMINSNGLISARGLAVLAQPTSRNGPWGPCLQRDWARSLRNMRCNSCGSLSNWEVRASRQTRRGWRQLIEQAGVDGGENRLSAVAFVGDEHHAAANGDRERLLQLEVVRGEGEAWTKSKMKEHEWLLTDDGGQWRDSALIPMRGGWSGDRRWTHAHDE
jgi:hypothetical protein